jgi:sulfide:quinone oxidoreductase
MRRIAILGAGTAGTMMANKLAKTLPDDWAITVFDRDDDHLYQPGLLFLPFGTYRDDEVVRRRSSLLSPRVDFRRGELSRVDSSAKEVITAEGAPVPFDVLIVATGSRIAPELTPGLTSVGWGATAFDFYTLEGARALRTALAKFERGRVVLNVAEMPIKCPVAPLEFLFLADEYFQKRGIRSQVDLIYATPLEGAFTKPRASAAFGDLLKRRNIEVVGDFSLSEVDGSRRVIKSFDGREQPYDLLVCFPLHAGAAVITASGLGDGGGWVPTDNYTLQSKAFPWMFVLGDATDLPSSKAGAVAHFQADVLFENVMRFLDGRPLLPDFDGHANCFIETGHGQAMLIDFNYDTEPLPGRFPLPAVGPFTLLEESAANHLGKLAFKWLYWNMLLPGRELPFDHRMQMEGKWSTENQAARAQS